MRTPRVYALLWACAAIGLNDMGEAAQTSACDSGAPTSPQGRWRTHDEVGPRALVDIRLRGAELVAVVAEIFARPSEPGEPRCDECPGNDRGKPIRGLEILRLAPAAAPGTWEGTVLDPEEGRRYRAIATLADCGRVLELRGYVLLPIFGRVERWERVN